VTADDGTADGADDARSGVGAEDCTDVGDPVSICRIDDASLGMA
jgi:hypothetical protein